MKNKGFLVLFGSICLILVLALITAMPAFSAQPPKPVEKKAFYVGATLASSNTYPPTVALSKIVTDTVPELRLIPREISGGFTENFQLIKSGELKIGVCTADSADFAYNGTQFYKGKFLMPNLRTGLFYSITGFTVFVRKDSGVTNVRQLVGKPFGAGYAGSNTYFKTVTLMEQGVGIKPNWMVASEHAVFDAVRGGKIIGTTKFGFPEPMVLELNATVPLTILSVTLEDLERANKAHPGQFPPLLMPAGLYPGQDKPVQTFSSIPGWVIEKDFPADYVYKMAKAIEANPDPIFVDAVPKEMRFSLAGVTWEEAILRFSIIPIHAGLVRYFKEKGVRVPDRLIPPEAR